LLWNSVRRGPEGGEQESVGISVENGSKELRKIPNSINKPSLSQQNFGGQKIMAGRGPLGKWRDSLIYGGGKKKNTEGHAIQG